MSDNANDRAILHSSLRSAEAFYVRVPKTQVEFNIQLPPGRHYYRHRPLCMDEFLEIALSTPGSVICVCEKQARSPLPPRKSRDARQRTVVGRRLKAVDHVPQNAAILIYAPTVDGPADAGERRRT
jgi:hypothetical protein